jgi:hypothetical protein
MRFDEQSYHRAGLVGEELAMRFQAVGPNSGRLRMMNAAGCWTIDAMNHSGWLD